MILMELKKRLLQARKDKDEVTKAILQVVIGEIQNASANRDLSDADCCTIMHRLKKANFEILECLEKMQNEGCNSKTCREVEKLLKENEVLDLFLPVQLSQVEIEAFLQETDPGFVRLRTTSSDSQATGLAIRALTAAQKDFDRAAVADIVKEIRNNS